MTDDCGFVFSVDSDDNQNHVLYHLHGIKETLNRLEAQMTSFADDQSHLDADVTAETTDLDTIIAELKAAQAAGHPLDFTKADAFAAALHTDAAPPAVTPPVVPPPVVTPPPVA